MRIRRILVLLTVALFLVPAAPAFAQVQGNENPPATGGPSGTGGNTPNAGNTGGGTESPSMSNDSGATGKIVAVIGVGFVLVAIAVAASTARRHRAVQEGEPVYTGDR